MATETVEKKEEAIKPTPVFGSGTAFGAGTGFAGFTGVSSSAPAAAAPAAAAPAAEASGAAAAEGGEDGEAADPEEECQAEFKPVVQLDEVETSTGEEDEDCIIDLKCKLYRFDSNNNEWKERGIGQVRLLKHKANERIRLLMRQEKTLKIRANHIIMPGTKLQEHAGSDKAWVWSTVDFSEGEQKVELFCIRFGSAEKAQEFKAKYEECVELNTKALAGTALATAAKGDADADADADELADDLAAKAGVKGSKDEEEDEDEDEEEEAE
ncbi:RAN binding protein [Raphidocelis subcapitata]|uniref:RAN binding protein n=1 Tax=Raphidocelis subcapitata TaxID=307507 RepID=A0A2V0NPB3_9CHLO|nr:RAN binding protein [Raphidocelis subcapitata]|eukprot:GBF89434.1 RAN binding protein [Raphidocelis subcapitata]